MKGSRMDEDLNQSDKFHLEQREKYVEEYVAEIQRLKFELRQALVYLSKAKKEFRPWTTNSLVDDFLNKHAALLEDKPCLASNNTSGIGI